MGIVSANATISVQGPPVGGNYWVYPDRIFALDGSCAFGYSGVSFAGTSAIIYAKGFGLSIPSGSTVDSITVTVADKYTAASDRIIHLTGLFIVKQDGTVIDKSAGISNLLSVYPKDVITSKSDVIAIGGLLNDLDVNGSNFGIGIQYTNLSGVSAYGISVDYMAISMNYTEPVIPEPPIADPATDISRTGFTANWEAATGATGYYLDVATDAGFTSMISGYNNKNVGNVLQYSLTPGVGLYFYRVRAYSGAGTSENSNVISVQTLGPSLDSVVGGNKQTIVSWS